MENLELENVTDTNLKPNLPKVLKAVKIITYFRLGAMAVLSIILILGMTIFSELGLPEVVGYVIGLALVGCFLQFGILCALYDNRKTMLRVLLILNIFIGNALNFVVYLILSFLVIFNDEVKEYYALMQSVSEEE